MDQAACFFKARLLKGGAHVHGRLFVRTGEHATWALAGQIVLLEREWEVFAAILDRGGVTIEREETTCG
jgi:hypothetical protein